MPEGFLPEIVVCPITSDMTGPPNLSRIPFEIGDSIEEHIMIPDCGLTIAIYKERTIEIEEKVRKVICIVSRTGLNTRLVQILIKFVEDKIDSYTMSITLQSV